MAKVTLAALPLKAIKLKMKMVLKRIQFFISDLLKILVGFQCLVLICLTVMLPCSPILAFMFFVKKVEQIVYRNVHNATVISSSDRSRRMEDRIILIILNGRFPLQQLRDLFIRNVLDLHSVDGVLQFPNVTKRIKRGWLADYWVDEKLFSISEHIKSTGDGNEEYSSDDLPKLLGSIQRKQYEDTEGAPLSPWSIHTATLTGNRCAVMFKINVALNDIEMIRALLSSHENPYEAKIKLDINNFSDITFLQSVKNIGLIGWQLFTVVMAQLSNTRFKMRQVKPRKMNNNKKVYFCSKNLKSTTFQKIGHHIGVSSRYVILANVTMAMQGIAPYHSFSLSNYEFDVNAHEITVELPIGVDGKITKMHKNDIKSFIKNFKSSTSLDPVSYESMLGDFVSRFHSLFIPTCLLASFTSSYTSPIRVDLNTFDMDGKDRLLGRGLQNFSVWNHGYYTNEKLKITITDCTTSLVISTVSSQSKEDISLKFLKRFHELYCQMSKEMGVNEET